MKGLSANQQSTIMVLTRYISRPINVSDVIRLNEMRVLASKFTNVWIPKGFCQVKKNPKIREKLGSGWVGQASTRIIIFFRNVFLCVFCVVFMFPNVSKKKIR